MTLKEARLQLVSIHSDGYSKTLRGDSSGKRDMEAAQLALDMLPNENTLEFYETKMKELAEFSKADPEAAHSEADKLLCKLLTSTGYGSIVEAYKQVNAWYA